MSENFADCEVCGEYCGDKKYKARLLIELPEELQEKLDKSQAWLCFKWVRKHCFETIGNIMYDNQKNYSSINDNYLAKSDNGLHTCGYTIKDGLIVVRDRKITVTPLGTKICGEGKTF